MYEKFGQFIDGKWRQSSDKKTYDVINPATEEIIGQASKATKDDVDRALRSAEKGLRIFNSDKIQQFNEPCGSSEMYGDLRKQKIYQDYV